MFKRISLFLVTNILFVVTISIILNLLGVGGYLTASGIDYRALMVFCLVWGMAGSFLSLAMSRVMAKWAAGVQVIPPNAPGELGWLVNTVHSLAKRANLPAMPEVGVYESPEVNAFATGPTKSRSLVAVSTGLLRSMRQDEIEGVLGHEVAHIQNGDMVTMTLLQGVVNAFVMFFARAIAFAITQALNRNSDSERSSFWMQFAIVAVLEIIFGILGMIVVGWFSRQREFRADKGGATLAGRGQMIGALEALQRRVEQALEPGTAQSLSTMKISSGRPSGLMALIATHPPLDDRIAALKSYS